jgi:hypothetical protein
MDFRVIENRCMLYMYCVCLSSCADFVACGLVPKQSRRGIVSCNFPVQGVV